MTTGQRAGAVAIIVSIGILGAIGLLRVGAQTLTADVEPETGQAQSTAHVVTDSTASASQAIQFGAAPPIPTTVPTNFSRLFTEDFNTPAPVGSFDTLYSKNWGEYSGFTSTNHITMYDPTKVLSVSGGSLFYYMHSENGTSYAAAPQAMNYKTFLYGQVGMSVRLDASVGSGYKIAFLLWPATNQWTNEVDFPEVDPDFSAPIRAASLNTTTSSGTHTFSGVGDTGYTFTDHKYHTFLLDWRPGAMTATIDGKVVATFSGTAVPAQAMRLSMQAEGWINHGAVPVDSTATLEVPWVYINSYTGP